MMSVHGWICWVNDYSEVACWVSTGERQAARIRGLYLRAILRQDISFFDKETNTGEVVGRMSGDTLLIQEALGEKVGKFIQCVACFLGGLVIAFIKGWLLTLVLLSCIPPLVISGSMMSFAFEKLASRGQAAYSEAATVVERTIGCIIYSRESSYSSIKSILNQSLQDCSERWSGCWFRPGEPILFSCSIKENIAYGKDGATNEEIRAATELANAAKFIDRFPHGVDTIVGEHATQLSGGQKQRIAIAMAILKDPRILQCTNLDQTLLNETDNVAQDDTPLMKDGSRLFPKVVHSLPASQLHQRAPHKPH
ncbi:ABC transporter B family member 4 [Glycine soja]